jgi:hypothetical protein
MAVVENITVYRGEDYSAVITMVPLTDITGWSIQFTLRQNVWDTGTPLVTKTTAAGGVALNSPATAGVFTVYLTSADLTLTPGTYSWDCARTDSGLKSCLATGYLFLLPENTV